MRLSSSLMYDRFKAGDASYNGRFFTGVLTTGIYCLPSCKARKPKRANVRFFPSCDAARAAGFRPCRKCHPDDFARGADPILESIEALVDEVRSGPADFPDVRAIVRRSGFGMSRLFELLRQHYHATPADLLLRARLERAQRLLTDSDAGIAEVAAEAGFESLSVFHEHFRGRCGMTPAQYRRLRSSDRFEVALPGDYPLAYLRRALGRDPQSLTERLSGSRYEAALRLAEEPVILQLDLSDRRVSAAVIADPAPNGSLSVRAHAAVARILGLDQDAAAFARLAKRLGLGRLVEGRSGLRVVQTLSAWDGLVWAIIGQQINFPFACTLKRRLVELAHRHSAERDRLFPLPTPAWVAGLQPADLAPLQFSRKKAEYLIGAAALVATGKLDLEGLRRLSATRAERTLLAIHGVGPWSANYLMMRSLGFEDCVPLGDTGVSSALVSLFELEERPDADTTRRLMAIFSPYRSLATYHLWQLLSSPP